MGSDDLGSQLYQSLKERIISILYGFHKTEEQEIVPNLLYQ